MNDKPRPSQLEVIEWLVANQPSLVQSIAIGANSRPASACWPTTR